MDRLLGRATVGRTLDRRRPVSDLVAHGFLFSARRRPARAAMEG
jgi:hypothetical protein